MKTDKMQRFERLAEKRANDAIRKLRLLSNLANKSNYAYTADHVSQLMNALKKEMRELEAKFGEDASPSQNDFKFKVSSDEKPDSGDGV